jgi:uncharacterized repeat protein (TIGR03803 family)
VKQNTSPGSWLSQSIEAVSQFHLGRTSYRGLFTSSIVSAALVLALSFAVPNVVAQVTILHSFGDGTVPNDGWQPTDGLTQTPDGNFYGVTLSAPIGNPASNIFRITPSGTLSVIQNVGHPDSKYAPFFYNNELINTYTGRYKKQPGVLFSLTGYPNGPWRLHTWHLFSGAPSDASGEIGHLILGADRNLFGVSADGGSANQGTIYKVDPKSHQVTIVYSFPSSSLAVRPTTGLLLAADGNFYGCASALYPNPGEVYKMTPNGDVTTFYQFTGSRYPSSRLIQGSDGSFYGAAGGLSRGGSLVYKLSIGGVLKILHQFIPGKKQFGIGTAGVVQGPNGNLYGLTNTDGTAGKGTVYEVSTDGSIFVVLHNFGDGSVPNDGAYPDGTLTVGADGNLYGVTTRGGSAGNGIVFKISP